MKSNVEAALHLCGRFRVFHREGPEPAIAIRWDGPQQIVSPDGTQAYLVSKAETLDDAGALAAARFAARIKEEAARLSAWADSIVKALEREP